MNDAGGGVGCAAHPPRSNAPSGRRRDAGMSMIEVLVAVVLLGTAGVAVLTAMATATIGARTHDGVADAQLWLASTGDRLMSSSNDTSIYEATGTEVPGYVSCADRSRAEIMVEYQAQVDELLADEPNAPATVVAAVDFWNGSDFVSTCHVSSQHRLQRITLTVGGPDGVASLDVIRRPYSADEVPVDEGGAGGGGGTEPETVEIELNPYLSTTTTSTTTTTTTIPSLSTTVAPGPTSDTTSATTSTSTTSTTTTSSTTSTTTTTTTPSTTTAPAPAAVVACSAVVTSKWNNGYVVNVNVTNFGATKVDGWTARVTHPEDPRLDGGGWNAVLHEQGTDVIATPDAEWNRALDPGETVGFGYQGKGGSSLPQAGNPIPCSIS